MATNEYNILSLRPHANIHFISYIQSQAAMAYPNTTNREKTKNGYQTDNFKTSHNE